MLEDLLREIENTMALLRSGQVSAWETEDQFYLTGWRVDGWERLKDQLDLIERAAVLLKTAPKAPDMRQAEAKEVR